MEHKRLASLPLSKEVRDRIPQEVIEMLLRLLLCVDELASRLNKHSGNSGKPPSSDSPFRKRRDAPPARTSFHKRAGVRQKLFPPTLLLPLFCSCGGVHFKDAEPFYTYQIPERPKIDPHVEHFVPHRARCADCGRLVSGPSFGKEYRLWPRLSDMAVELAGCHGDSRRAVQDFPPSVPGISVSPGSRPVALFSDARESCCSVTSARSLLSLLNSIYLLLRKQLWQSSVKAAFCRFPAMETGGNLACRNVWRRNMWPS